MKSINDIIEAVIAEEGGYVNNHLDKGGETNFGITKSVALSHGYTGDMKNLTIDMARAIYYADYVSKPGFDKVYLLSPQVAAELVDTGVNMGPGIAVKFLQQSLNAFNNGLYQDLIVDGALGQATISAMAAYMKARKEKAVDVLLKSLNCLQGARYIDIASNDHTQKVFTFGWIDNRVKL